MILPMMAASAAMLALQSAPQAAPTSPPITTLDQLPIEEAAAPRCAVAFAIVARWQAANDPRGSEYPDMQEDGGREFFVRTLAGLMEARELSREAATDIIFGEVRMLSNPEGAEQIAAMMPACLLMKRSVGL